MRVAVVGAIVLVAVGIVVMKNRDKGAASAGLTPSTVGAAGLAASAVEATPATPATIATTGLPRLLDLGATKCVPCKMMAPLLEEIKKEYAGKLQVDFIDVWENPAAGDQYGIQSIPTQIFFDASGKELFRHVGFMPKEDILAKWKVLGVVLNETTPMGVTAP